MEQFYFTWCDSYWKNYGAQETRQKEGKKEGIFLHDAFFSSPIPVSAECQQLAMEECWSALICSLEWGRQLRQPKYCPGDPQGVSSWNLYDITLSYKKTKMQDGIQMGVLTCIYCSVIWVTIRHGTSTTRLGHQNSLTDLSNVKLLIQVIKKTIIKIFIKFRNL